MEIAGDESMKTLQKLKNMMSVRAFAVGAFVLAAPFAAAEDNAPFRTALSVTGGLSVGSLGGVFGCSRCSPERPRSGRQPPGS